MLYNIWPITFKYIGNWLKTIISCKRWIFFEHPVQIEIYSYNSFGWFLFSGFIYCIVRNRPATNNTFIIFNKSTGFVGQLNSSGLVLYVHIQKVEWWSTNRTFEGWNGCMLSHLYKVIETSFDNGCELIVIGNFTD